jgi:signal transduction histidine kinase
VQAQRLGRLAADLRKLTELEAFPFEQVPVDLGELLDEAVEQARLQRSANPERLVLSLPRAPWPLPPVRGDRDLLFLAIYNLLDNALKFTEDDQIVEVRAFEDRTSVAIVVADKGRGVPADELPYIFEELYRGKNARGVPGSGHGLPLVGAVVARHGGSVIARSQLGQGSEFTLRLPSADVSEWPRPHIRMETARSSG